MYNFEKIYNDASKYTLEVGFAVIHEETTIKQNLFDKSPIF